MKSLSLHAINESSSYEVSAVYDGCYQFRESLTRAFDELHSGRVHYDARKLFAE